MLLHPSGSVASSMSMLGISSTIAKRAPHFVQTKTSSCRLRGAFPTGQTSKASNSSLTMIDSAIVIHARKTGAALLRNCRESVAL